MLEVEVEETCKRRIHAIDEELAIDEDVVCQARAKRENFDV